MDQTIAYYDSHADAFVQDTVTAQMHTQQDAFLSYLPANARVLDFGAGSGRDSLYFMQHRCSVDMVDGSAAMCEACEKLTGKRAVLSTFLEFQTEEKFDGIWACASLLHLHRDEIPIVLSHLAEMLDKPNVMYLSFKYGDFAGERNGRYFTDLTEESFSAIIDEANALEATRRCGTYTVDKIFMTEDVRPGRNTQWLNAFVRLL